MKRKKGGFGTKTVTMTAIFTALGVVFLFIGSVFEFLDLTAAMAASLIIVCRNRGRRRCPVDDICGNVRHCVAYTAE